MKREKDNPGRGKVKLKVGVEHVLKFKRVSKLCNFLEVDTALIQIGSR